MGTSSRPAPIVTVSELTAKIKLLLEDSFPAVWVEGEISNLSLPQSGHAYFTLKDERAQIRAVLFRSSHRSLKFTLQHGMQVICRGRLGLYEPRGEYQLILDYLEPKGLGALQLAFEQLRDRLEKEGLFDPARKQAIPVLPQKIGLVTSPTGAAIRDILRVIRRRHPRMHLLLYPVPVQGPEAAPAIIEAIRYFNKQHPVDVMIVGRGGGSLEDLWAFNEESVARAIAASKVPVISAVGHETDTVIADLAADLRAPTPSAAAEMVVESEERFRSRIAASGDSLVRSLRRQLESARSLVREHLLRLGDPWKLIEQRLQRIDELGHRMGLGVRHHLTRDRARLSAALSALEHLNLLGILGRGFSITTASDGTVVRDAAEVAAGDLITTRLRLGRLVSRVEQRFTDTESGRGR